MKKRNIAVMMLMCITMAGCSSAVSTRGAIASAPGSVAVTDDDGVVKVYSEKEIEQYGLVLFVERLQKPETGQSHQPVKYIRMFCRFHGAP